MLKYFRKKLRIENQELDEFLHNKNTSTKYYVENSYLKNKAILYLVLLRIKGVNINSFFDQVIEDNEKFKNYKKWKKSK
jgi:hypothetical protein